MKTKEELKKLKQEIEALNKKLSELSEEELKQVCGGTTEEDIQHYEVGIFPGLSGFP